jgi:catechol 2,3-dioxygenase-like lactoylglutathione lyase family enzyme
MKQRIQGLHHITLCTGSAQADVDFFVKTLGQRFIKRTLFYDGREPIYHLYFADELGTPGTVMTTFPMRRTGIKGRKGSGQFQVCSYAIPKGSISFWQDHLGRKGIEVSQIKQRFGQNYASSIPTAASASKWLRIKATRGRPGLHRMCRSSTPYVAFTAGLRRLVRWVIWTSL